MALDIFYPVVSGDDGYGVLPSGDYNNSDTVLYFGGLGDGYSFWMRFPSVTIPQGAIVTGAFIRFTCSSNTSGVTCNISCYFNTEDDAVAPTNIGEFNVLSLTDAIEWDALSAWVDGIQYDTPSIVSILQNIIDREGWESGNAVQLVAKNNLSSINAYRAASSIDFSSGVEKAELHVTWTPTSEVVYYISGYVKEGINPINRQIYAHNRDTGILVGSTTSSGAGGYFYATTTYSGSHYVVCLDDEIGADYNDLIYGNIYPVTISG